MAEQESQNKVKRKIFRDPIHGDISIHPVCVAIINTPQFQRLRSIKQLGTCYHVYPGATHNRFEHSIGVCYLAGKFAKCLKKNQPELEIKDNEILCLEIAGLCRGLGTGPYSHVFEDAFLPKSGLNCNLKQITLQLFNYILKQETVIKAFKDYKLGNPSDTNRNILFIRNMILAEKIPQNRRFLYEIICDEGTGIAVHTFDYLARDCYHLGFKNLFDHKRYMKFARVINVNGAERICLRDKEIANLYNLYFTKYTLTRFAYRHKVTEAVQLMLAEMMERAKHHPFFKLSGQTITSCLEDAEAYTALDDNIIYWIMDTENTDLTAKELANDILSRKFYYCVCESQPLNNKCVQYSMTVEEITQRFIGAGARTFENGDIIVEKKYLSLRKTDPQKCRAIYTYSKANRDEAQAIQYNESQGILSFGEESELLIRVYIKQRNDVLQNHVYQAFYKWINLPQGLPASISVGGNKKNKIFNDPVHGHIEMNAACLKIIDTAEFQRLRNISHLGMVYFLYPGASHNKFEHSLGVCHLTGQYIQELQKTTADIDDKDILCLEIAALCYSLGSLPDGLWSNEERAKKTEKASAKMFKHLLENNNDIKVCLEQENGLEANDITFITELINSVEPTGSTAWPYKGRPESKSYLYEVVLNRRNGIDAYTWDCIARDCHHLGIKNNFDPQRYMKFARVIDVDGEMQICMRDKEIPTLYSMFYSRYMLQKCAYHHKKTAILQLMINETFQRAKKILKIGDKYIEECMTSMDMEHFSKITDFLLFKIKLNSTEGDLLKFEAKMIENIFKRNLFECVFESSPIKADIFDRNKTKIEIEDELKTMIVDDSNSHGIQPNLFIKMTYLDFGMKEANPVERLKVYSKDDFTKARHFTKEEASKVFGPATFNEVIVRVFLNNTNRMYSTDVMGRLRESSEKTIKRLVK